VLVAAAPSAVDTVSTGATAGATAGAAAAGAAPLLLLAAAWAFMLAWRMAAAAAAFTCGGVSTSPSRGERANSSEVKMNSSGCKGEPSGIVVVGRRNSSKKGCSHAYREERMDGNRG